MKYLSEAAFWRNRSLSLLKGIRRRNHVKAALIRNMDTSKDKVDIDVAGLNAGVYMMKIQMKDMVKVARFIKE